MSFYSFQFQNFRMKKLIYNAVVFIALPFICATQITFSGIVHTAKSNRGDFIDKDLFHNKENISEYTDRIPLQLQQDARSSIVQQRLGH